MDRKSPSRRVVPKPEAVGFELNRRRTSPFPRSGEAGASTLRGHESMAFVRPAEATWCAAPGISARSQRLRPEVQASDRLDR